MNQQSNITPIQSSPPTHTYPTSSPINTLHTHTNTYPSQQPPSSSLFSKPTIGSGSAPLHQTSAMQLHSGAGNIINFKNSDFPHAGLLPRTETQVDTFLQQHPTFDGRGVIVAIFDTGCDPSAAGLQVTTDGKPKFIDIVDATGSGDVDTSHVVKINNNLNDNASASSAAADTSISSSSSANLQNGTSASPTAQQTSDATQTPPSTSPSSSSAVPTNCASSSNELQLLTGRRIAVPPHWNNPTNEFRLGMKAAYDLYPAPLKERVSKQRTEKFMEDARALQATLHQQLQSIQQMIARNRIDKLDDAQSQRAIDEKEDIELLIAECKSMVSNFHDVGPLWDCILFNDGTNWRAVVIPNDIPDDDIPALPAMTDYYKEYQYAFFSSVDMLSYTVNIYENGNVLNICTNAGSHGTHVAGIVGANFPNQPELNGNAPGCQMISVKIGDSRLGSMETGTALIRAMKHAIDWRADIINMSYGEASSKPMTGRVAEFAAEVVNKHNIIYISSAGNNGPALSTVGSLGGTESSVIGVGAYVSEAMMQAGYSMTKSVNETAYSWSSRGPALDGWIGPSICSVGGAITSVPSYTLQKQQLMNGTSMSSPAAAGSTALLLSGLRQSNLTWTPARIRATLENTARQIISSDNLSRLTYGAGLIQTNTALQYLTKNSSLYDLDFIYNVTVPSLDNARGIYLRNAVETNKQLECTIQIDAKSQPYYSIDLDNANDELVKQRHQQLIQLQMAIKIVNNADWIQAPSHLLLTNGSRSFSIVVDSTQLPPGTHFTELCGYDSTNPHRGIVFRVPVTVCKSEPPQIQPHTPQAAEFAATQFPTPIVSKEDSNHVASITALNQFYESQHHWCFNKVAMSTGGILRKILTVPYGALYIDVRISSKHVETVHTFMLHLIYLKPETAYRVHEANRLVTVNPNDSQTFTLDVEDTRVMELCLASYWNQPHSTDIDIDVQFHGITLADRNRIAINGNHDVTRIDVQATLRSEHLAPKITLNTLSQPLRPASNEIKPLDPVRHTLPNNRLSYLLLLTYNYEVKEDNVKLRPYNSVNGRLYEAMLHSQLGMLFDSNRRLIHTFDAFTSAQSVKKGKYVYRLHLSHHDVNVLEKFKDLILNFETSLPKPTELNIYNSYNEALTHSKSALVGDNRLLKHGRSIALFITSVDNKSLPSMANKGDCLKGTAYFIKATATYASKGAVQRGEIPVLYTVQSPSTKEKEDEKSTADPIAEESESDNKGEDEAIRESQIKYIEGIKDKKTQLAVFNLLYPLLKEKFPSDSQVLSLRLTVLKNTSTDKSTNEDTVRKLIEAANDVTSSINQESIQLQLAKQVDPKDNEGRKKRKHAEAQKSILISALHSKAEVLAEYIKKQIFEKKEEISDVFKDLFESTYKELISLVGDLSSKENRAKYITVSVLYYRLHVQYGHALKILSAQLEADAQPKKSLVEEKIQILKQIGWHRWAKYMDEWMKRNYPASYTLF